MRSLVEHDIDARGACVVCILAELAGHDVEPAADRLVLFWSNQSHEVLPVAGGGGPRCAFTQWFSAVR